MGSTLSKEEPAETALRRAQRYASFDDDDMRILFSGNVKVCKALLVLTHYPLCVMARVPLDAILEVLHFVAPFLRTVCFLEGTTLTPHVPFPDTTWVYCSLFFSQTWVDTVAQTCSRLQRLDAPGTTLTGTQLRVIVSACPNIVSLHLADCKNLILDPPVADCIPPNLTELDISRTPSSRAEIVAIVSRCHQLRSLAFAATPHLTTGGTPIEDLGYLSRTNARLMLTADFAFYPDDTPYGMFKTIALHCPHLTSIDFSHDCVFDEEVMALAIKCKDLKHVNAYGCFKLTKQSLDRFPKECKVIRPKS